MLNYNKKTQEKSDKLFCPNRDDIFNFWARDNNRQTKHLVAQEVVYIGKTYSQDKFTPWLYKID